jgi:hypothetical protein
MPKITLTDFLDVVAKSGSPKATKVAEMKRRPPYDPRTDFYKAAREGIVAVHAEGRRKASLDEVLVGLSDPKKITAYPELIKGYKTWWGRKALEWFPPPTGTYSAHGVDVSIHPELGLRIDNEPHIIKLYFKAAPLAANRCELIIHLMETNLARGVRGSQPRMAVLDVRRSKLLACSESQAPLSAMLDAELAYIAAIWPNL